MKKGLLIKTVVFRPDDFPEIRSKKNDFGRIPIFQFLKYFRPFSSKKIKNFFLNEIFFSKNEKLGPFPKFFNFFRIFEKTILNNFLSENIKKSKTWKSAEFRPNSPDFRNFRKIIGTEHHCNAITNLLNILFIKKQRYIKIKSLYL
jgi:hypothetical protein